MTTTYLFNKSAMDELAGAWKRINRKDGSEYWSGRVATSITIKDGQQIMILKNKYKVLGDSRPEYIVYVADQNNWRNRVPLTPSGQREIIYKGIMPASQDTSEPMGLKGFSAENSFSQMRDPGMESMMYVAGFGKYKGQMLDTIEPMKLIIYCDWLKKESAKSGKPMSARVKKFIAMVDASLDNQKKEQVDEHKLPF